MRSSGTPQQLERSCPGSHLFSMPLWVLREGVQHCLWHTGAPLHPQNHSVPASPSCPCRAAAGTLTHTGSQGSQDMWARGTQTETALRPLSRPAGLPGQVWSPELLKGHSHSELQAPGRAGPAAQHRDKGQSREPTPARAVPTAPGGGMSQCSKATHAWCGWSRAAICSPEDYAACKTLFIYFSLWNTAIARSLTPPHPGLPHVGRGHSHPPSVPVWQHCTQTGPEAPPGTDVTLRSQELSTSFTPGPQDTAPCLPVQS